MKKSIKLSLLGLAILLASNIAKAQNQSNILIQASQNITNFKFIGSDGVLDEGYLPNYSGSYALGYRYDMEMGVSGGVKLGMRKAGATYVFDNTNYSWNLDYFEARLFAGYHYSFDKLSAGIAFEGYFGMLLKANQRLNNEDFDIINTGAINKSDFGVLISPGINYKMSDYISAYLDINYMLGLANLESDETQQSFNKLIGATLGLAFAIK